MVNPVYKTAKTTLFALADSGDEDAKKLCEKMSLTAKSAMTSVRSGANEKTNLVSDLVVDTRYSTIGKMALEATAEAVVDLPCGYTPRGIQFSRKNQRYIGLDLPATVSEGEPLLMSLIDESKKLKVKLRGRVDTLTAPEILSLYEQMNKDSNFQRVNVDCDDLVYISSAGLRVLLIMNKRSKKGVRLTGVCKDVEEILAQTGFDSILQIG